MSSPKPFFPVLIWTKPYGKFCLSPEVIAELRKYHGDDLNSSNIPRHDKRLIEVVIRLGLKRSNGNGNGDGLEIVFCTEGRYVIRRNNKRDPCERMIQTSDVEEDWITP